MALPTLYLGDLLATLDRMGLAGDLFSAEDAVEGRHDHGKLMQVANAFGFDWRQPAVEQVPDDREKPDGRDRTTVIKKIAPKVPPDSPPMEKLQFWVPLRKSLRIRRGMSELPPELRDLPPSDLKTWAWNGEPLRGTPLMPWSRLWPLLRQILSREVTGRRPDVPRLVRTIALGRPMHRLPLRRRSAWCSEVLILEDCRAALSPYRDDFRGTIERIGRLRGANGLRVVPIRAEATTLLSLDTLEPVSLPRDVGSTAILALGDLGQYAGGLMSRPWALWGRRARAAGFTPWALCPCPQDRWIPSVISSWNTIYWDRHSRPPLDGRGQRALPWADAEIEDAQRRRNQQLNSLLRLVSPAIRIERGFLRDVRLLLGHEEADAGTEYDAFQLSDTVGSEEGISLTPARQWEFRKQLHSLVPNSLLREMLVLLRRHHAYSAAVFGAEELESLKLSLPEALWPLLTECGLSTPELEVRAARHWRQIAAGLISGDFGSYTASMKNYAMRGVDRVGGPTADSLAKQVIWALNHPQHEGEIPGSGPASALAFLQEKAIGSAPQIISVAGGLRLGALPPHDKMPIATVEGYWNSALVQLTSEGGAQAKNLRWSWQDAPRLTDRDLRRIDTIRIDGGTETVEFGKLPRPDWASRLWYDRGELKARFTCDGHHYLFERTWVTEGEAPLGEAESAKSATTKPEAADQHQRFSSVWTCSKPPAWVSRLWADHMGLAVEFHIRSIPFVLRWMPPGRFLMGSPEDEPGRYDDEGPRHEVRIKRGFWMGETPVTQAQWRAVVEAAGATPGLLNRLLGKKSLNPAPSHFKGPADLPVESVTWEESALFCRLLDALVPGGLGFRLPTEAQWEYACRAGTETALFSGEIEILGQHNAPALDPVAWYGGNSGQDLEVTNPVDSSDWPEKQFHDSRAGTHRVKLKAANPWGLYDVHGNVWEWCRDAWDAEAYAGRQAGAVDPLTENTASDASRVVRGGSWLAQALLCRAAIRDRARPGNRPWYLGVRLSAGQEPAELQRSKERSDSLPERRSRARGQDSAPATRNIYIRSPLVR